ncbi:MAG: NACHT domain-containing protein [Hyphomicrobiales bacterium]|nr:NACHT domain-containing protein [Hyphomicrobiales bacterium]MBV9428322.1 NACHT domain-containing protein [Bradyrhizobiaceae bacterium]
MNTPAFNIEHLSSRLGPALTGALKEGEAFAEIFGKEVSQKASSSLAGAAINTIQSLGKAAWKTIRSSRAHDRFYKRWLVASSASERHQAIRKLLIEDPKCASSLYRLLTTLDFLRATAEHAEHLPNIAILEASRRLSEIYVPLRIEPITHEPAGEAKFHGLATDLLLSSGNHLIEGAPGSGKSTLARWLVLSQALSILETDKAGLIGQTRLPVLVNARTLKVHHSSFATAIANAVRTEMSFAMLAEVPDQFFIPYSEDGHKSWLVIVDGLDEIEDRHERQRLWDMLARVHSQNDDSFRFLVFTRPDAVRTNWKEIYFQHWHIQSLTGSDHKLIAERYISLAEKVEVFLTDFERITADEIHRYPLFEAIAATIFSKTGATPKTKSALCDAFVHALLEKSTVAHLDRRLVREALTLLADNRPLETLNDCPEIRALIPRDVPRIQIGDYFKEIAQRTGLVTVQDGTLVFIHEVFRSYFIASRVAALHSPDRTIWRKVDPFRLGWSTIQYVCENWELAGKDVSLAVESLLSFGKRGQMCAAEISIACRSVNEKVVEKIVEWIFREMFSTGPTIFGVDALTRLSATREVVTRKLIDTVYSGRDFFDARLQCAECLVESGQLKEGLRALEFIARGEREYDRDRIRAAELLLAQGEEKLAHKVLIDMAHHAEDRPMRAEAATILFKSVPSEANRELVANIITEEHEDELESVYESTMERLLALGEKALALPILRDRTGCPDKPGPLSQLPRSEIDACIAIATFHDPNEAIARLKAMLSWPHISVRGKVEVVEAIGKVGAEDEARRLLRQLVGKGPTYDGADWFMLEMLRHYGLFGELQLVGFNLLDRSLKNGRGDLDAQDIVGRLALYVPRDRLAAPIRAKLGGSREPRLLACLAKLGQRDEAIDTLKQWVKEKDVDLCIDAAEVLCVIGERSLGVRSLNRIVRDDNLDPDLRMQAAHALERVDEISAAEKAYFFLLRDKNIPMKERCRAAQRLCREEEEEEDSRVELIWNILLPELENETAPVCDRAMVGEFLLDTSLPDWTDVEYTDVCDALLAILESGSVSGRNAWAVVAALARSGYPYREVPGASDLAKSAEISVETRIKGLQRWVVYGKDRDAAKDLIEIARAWDTPYKHAIEALHYVRDYNLSDSAEELLERITNDPEVPPAWRLKAVFGAHGERFGGRRSEEKVGSIIRDCRISTRARLAALHDLTRLSIQEQQALINEIAATPGLSTWDRLHIAESAITLKAPHVAEALIKEVLVDAPHSIAELSEMGKLLNSMGERRRAISLLERVANLPDLVLEEAEEHSSSVEAAQLLAKLGEHESAVAFLWRLVGVASYHDITDILECIDRLAGADEAKRAALQLQREIVAEPEDPRSGYMGMWREVFELFLTKRWIADLHPLLIVARDSSKLLSDRAGAATAIYRNRSFDASGDWGAVAHQILVELSKDRNLSVRDRVGLIDALKSCELEAEAEEQIKSMQESRKLDLEDRLALAEWLFNRGEGKRARGLLDEITDAERVGGYFGPGGERVIEELQGAEAVRQIQALRAFNEQESISERLLEARDMVEECGNREALRLILNTARGQYGDSNDRLWAIDTMEELDYRAFPREMLPEIIVDPDIDQYWAGDLLLRFGDKAGALERLRRAITSCPESYHGQIARRLADLQAVSLLEQLKQMESMS